MGSWNNHNIVNLLLNREIKAENARQVKRHWQFTDRLIKRLGLEYELEGHQGCVNCLQWTADGRFLASGSDDTNVILWDPFKHKSIKKCPTPHIGNIFSVKFLGREGSLFATAAGDCRVIVQNLENADAGQPHLDCKCHVGRVKRLAVAPDQPLLFWSAGEDGYVIQYDLREPHECIKQSTVFMDLSYTSEVKCITVNPTKPHLVAIGADDCFIRIYDRRMVRTAPFKPTYGFDRQKRTPPEPQDPNCVQYYAPGHLAKDSGGEISYKLAATYIAFNAAGSEMLVNMGGEQIYLFDVNNPRHTSELRVPHTFPKRTINLSEICCSMVNKPTPTLAKCKKGSKTNRSRCACSYNRRASKLFQRKWTGDLYSAARDYLHVIQYWPDNFEAYIGLIECLIALKWPKEAVDWVDYFCKKYPNSREEKMKRLRETANSLEAGSSAKKEDGAEETREKILTDEEKQLRLEARDYELRFLGHCNTTTDIKEANFLGEDGRYICAGSDDAVIFIWDRTNTNIIHALMGDMSIVNCVQPHPSACLIASSGIDTAVKLWSPMDEDGAVNSNAVTDLRKVIELNQARMSMDPLETMLVNMGYRIRDGPFLEGSLDVVPTCRTS